MLVIRLWNYFRGYVIIKIEGLSLENFINLTISKGIYLWDIERINYTTLQAKIGIKAFKELREIIKRIGCRVNIINKKGFPFFMHKLKYRKMMAFGLIICMGVLFFLTSIIWSIDIVGEEDVSKQLILKNLQKIGVYIGANKSDIDVEEIKNSLLKDIDSISYAKADIKGTKLIVEIKKRDNPQEMIDDDTPCNIVSTEIAVIEKIVAKNGKAVVKKGDIVKVGQVLITGVIEDERFENPLLVSSEGIVLGKLYHTKIIEEPIVKTIKEESGKVIKHREILFGNKRIYFDNKEIPFQNYIESETNKNILNFEKFKLGLVVHEYKEVKLTKITQNIDKLKRINFLKGSETLINELPEDAKIVSKNVDYKIENNKLITKITIEVIKNIAKKQKI